MAERATSRGYFPTDDMDEVNPHERAHPTLWVAKSESGYRLDIDDPYLEPDKLKAKIAARPSLNDGDVVSFSGLAEHGYAWLEVDQNGKWTSDCPMPPEATHVWMPYEHEAMGRSLAELADLLGECRCEVQFYSFPETFWVFKSGAFEPATPDDLARAGKAVRHG